MSPLDVFRNQVDQRIFFSLALDSNVLLLSMREISDLVANCGIYEFEDLIASVTVADVARPANFENLELGRRAYKATRRLNQVAAIAPVIRPALGALKLTRTYDLFFPVFNNPWELYALHALDGWRSHSEVAICFITELWADSLPDYLLELLKDFDHILLGMSEPTAEVARITGRPCSYLPLGVDALKFCPQSPLGPRAIDICGLGRRSPITHRALLELAKQQDLFYFYDTIRTDGVPGASQQMTFRVGDPREHRYLLANLLKRSRYYLANRARANEPTVTHGSEEISARFFEGIAAGAVLLGDPPDSDEFRRLFDWPDATVKIPFDAPHVAEVIARLEADPHRVQTIRRENVANALLRHDWVYRLRDVYTLAGMRPSFGMLQREAQLSALAAELRREGRGTAELLPAQDPPTSLEVSK
ncbi:MAG: hypothetical protein H6Q89_4055 [Myxococcaceae bacterium]|nr:hypothetical protein [Myxococcaceae bacterium]